MTPQQTLTKAIQKASENGWTGYRSKIKNVSVLRYRQDDDFKGELNNIIYTIQLDDGSGLSSKVNVYELIFNHAFAMCLWGTKPHYRYVGDTIDAPTEFEYHLQQMVIAKDPIKYLKENM